MAHTLRILPAAIGTRSRRRSRLAIPRMVAAGLAVIGCASSARHAAGTSSTAAGTSSTAAGTSSTVPGHSTSTSVPQATRLKPALQGIVEINDLPNPQELPFVGGLAVSVPWRDIQPMPGGPIAPDNALDRAIAQVRTLNLAAGASIGIRARVLAGINAPEWAKVLNGPPVSVTVRQDNTSGTVGRFWTEAFGKAYVDLERKLAAKYDDVPEVREVTASRCTTAYAEPLIRQLADAATQASLLGAGYTDAADDRCQHEQIDAHLVWRYTRTGMAYNPYEHVGRSGRDTAATIRYMQYCRQALGSRCVLENNSIRWPVLGGGYEQMYQAMARTGPPISFQTAGPSRVGDLIMTLTWAADQGANDVELSQGLLQQAMPALPPIIAKLRANPTG